MHTYEQTPKFTPLLTCPYTTSKAMAFESYKVETEVRVCDDEPDAKRHNVGERWTPNCRSVE